VLSVIALVGRPNVGKSTLFNRLTRTKDALVADFPGLTRDRLYGFAYLESGSAIVIDTGGLTASRDEMDSSMSRQVEFAVSEADVVVLLVEGDGGPTAGDDYVANLIRRTGKPVLLVVNKSEGRVPEEAVAEFYALGMGEPLAISATRGDRINELMIRALAMVPDMTSGDRISENTSPAAGGIRIAVVGRPNVGKSTLINRYLGEERLVTHDRAGTTRDSIAIPFEIEGQRFVLVDTAGIRRKARVKEVIEKFSIVKSLQALEEADAVIVLLDAREGITDQDISLIGLILERGRALAVGVNKWDGLSDENRRIVRSELERKLPFLDFVDIHFLSALHGSKIFDLLRSTVQAAKAAIRDLPTPRLNEILKDAVAAHPPPIVGRHRVKLSYAHQGGKRPPTIVVHGNQTKRLPGSYRRYLIKRFRKVFRLKGTPVRLELRTGENPFAGRRNRLTPRQEKRRKRIRERKR
jgi:GTP-binding protein